MNVEVYQGQINEKYGTKFNIPVTCCSPFMAVAYGANAKEAGLDGNVVCATRLEEIAAWPWRSSLSGKESAGMQ